MNDWTAGYVADIGYTHGYYPELNPQRVELALLGKGIPCPRFETACELGFGHGVSAAIHSAGSTASWFGTDFNPVHAASAREMAAAADTRACFLDESFAEFSARTDLPEFDFIGLHGVWSWISEENREILTAFIRRRLKVGGVLYISYNTQPGWAAFAPLRELMSAHSEIMSPAGLGLVNRIDNAMGFAENLLATAPRFLRNNPFVAARIDKLTELNRHYLAHEYFNRDWQPMSFAAIAKSLQAAKVQYAAPAHYLDHIDALNLTPPQQAFLQDYTDPVFRESVRDFLVDQQFRRDYWVRGSRRTGPLRQLDAIRAHKVLLVTPRDEVRLKVTTSLGDIALPQRVFEPVLDLLATHQPLTLAELEQRLANKGLPLAELLEAVTVLSGAGHVATVQDAASTAAAKPRTDRLNAWLLDRAQDSGEVKHLASPVTGGGVPVSRAQQLFLLSARNGKQEPTAWAHDTWQLLSAQGQRVLKDGKPLDSEAENVAELVSQARHFQQRVLPILGALQI